MESGLDVSILLVYARIVVLGRDTSENICVA
jgi:hypothetical protein